MNLPARSSRTFLRSGAEQQFDDLQCFQVFDGAGFIVEEEGKVRQL